MGSKLFDPIPDVFFYVTSGMLLAKYSNNTPYFISCDHLNKTMGYQLPQSFISTFGFLLLLGCIENSNAQCTAGNIIEAHSSAVYDALLDPDGDGYITETGGAFTSGTTELAEFEIIPNSTTGWLPIQDVSETDSDITPNCGNSDLIQDDDGGDFAFYNIIDPTPASPSNGDEYILFRFRLAKSPNGNFGYNFLIDTDAAYGSTSDGNSTCGNMGFEREVQFANAGGKKGVSVYDVDGNSDFNSTLCNQCVAIADVQEACAASSGACATSDPQFITFPVPLSHIGVESNVSTSAFYIAAATASSGNATSVLGGGNVTDMGALDGGNTGCPCTGLSGCALFDCQTDCVNSAFTSLPVELLYFDATSTGKNTQLKWATATEIGNSHFEIEHSTDGINFRELAHVEGNGNSVSTIKYDFIHNNPEQGINYYRLKQLDYDGLFEFSPIKAVNFRAEEAESFSIIPSMATTNIAVKLFGIEQQDVNLYIFNSMGRKLRSENFKGLNSLDLNIEELPVGNYYMQVRFGERILVQRFVKRSY